MLDDLWEQDRPTRPRGSRKRRPERRTGRSAMALIISLSLLAALGAGVYWVTGVLDDMFGPKDYAKSDQTTTEVQVRIPPGAGGIEMAEILVEAGVIKATGPFIEAFSANDGQGQAIQPGTYRLYEKMPAADALAALLDRENNLVVIKVTIPEGYTTFDIFALLAEKTGRPVEEFVAAGKEPAKLGISDEWFARTDGKQAMVSLEGFLFPETYLFDPGATPTEILKMMVDQFFVVADETALKTKAADLGFSPYEVLIVASIVEAETRRAEDRGKAARTIYNRLLLTTWNRHVLELDSAVNYWFKSRGEKPKNTDYFTADEIHNSANPWNTHDTAGLPPTPISNPGKSAITAALAPEKGNWIYWVTVDDNTGETRFASTWSGHCTNIRTRINNGYDATPC